MSLQTFPPSLTILTHPTRLRLLQVLAAGPAQVDALSTSLTLSPATVRRHLSHLVAGGLVIKVDEPNKALPVFKVNRQAIAALALDLQTLVIPPVISIVAKSGTGKTTFMEKLIPALKQREVCVGVLKHHGHPTPFDVPGKDTYRHAQAGADVVVGASAVQVAVFRRENGAANLDAAIARHFAGLDLVLTEGYKRGSYPKIEVHRAARSHELLCEPEELLLLVTDEVWPLAVPQFGLEEAEAVADWLVAWLENQS
ncbi:MAG: molybdopterin-guanine dinucleotide biosynthesis protein B [Chloroflexi bacterium]|nr:molybdopterin-guanine dinucleotide biosynthesis protein B [Chloroflexota bacterium]